ncbi:hypothetical protein O9K51_04162 [Purpureocillium lavendulum]|uniref:Uncharacterized protein n=1 Tax=Purpureocillium lavendulum TaxID=1247861 RepID=A0AB34FVZ6_9HYPO|nr:hypothetical protein O9K51_04162 [Purpureocillium lavendulum]
MTADHRDQPGRAARSQLVRDGILALQRRLQEAEDSNTALRARVAELDSQLSSVREKLAEAEKSKQAAEDDAMTAEMESRLSLAFEQLAAADKRVKALEDRAMTAEKNVKIRQDIIDHHTMLTAGKSTTELLGSAFVRLWALKHSKHARRQMLGEVLEEVFSSGLHTRESANEAALPAGQSDPLFAPFPPHLDAANTDTGDAEH